MVNVRPYLNSTQLLIMVSMSVLLSLKWYNLFEDILVGGANRETVTIHNNIFYKLSQKRDGHIF